MKRSIVILTSISLIAFLGAGYLAKKTQTASAPRIDIQAPETTTVKSGLPAEIASVSGAPKQEIAEASAAEVSATPAPTHSRGLLGQVKTLEQFRREYANYKPHELKHLLSWSQAKLADSGLIEKSNTGTLNDQESFLLVTELRRQGAIVQVLTAREIARVKRKFL